MYENAKTVIIVISLCAIAFVAGLLIGYGFNKDSSKHLIETTDRAIERAENAEARSRTLETVLAQLVSRSSIHTSGIESGIEIAEGIDGRTDSLIRRAEQIKVGLEELSKLFDSPDNN